MRLRLVAWVVWIAAAGNVALIAPAFAQSTGAADLLPQASASYVANAAMRLGEEEIEMRVYHFEGMERAEMRLDDFSQITILRPDLGLAYIIQPGGTDYFQMSIAEVGPMALGAGLRGYQVNREDQEFLEGELTTRYRVSGQDESGGVADLLVWSTEDGIHVRIEGTYDAYGENLDISIVKSDIVRIPLTLDLFEPPAGARGRDLDSLSVDE